MAPNLQAWMDVLAKMEAEADAACRTQYEAISPWSPPQGLGPIPPELVQRARDVETAQQAAVGRLEEAKATTARHLAAIQSVREVKASGQAVFLDITG